MAFYGRRPEERQRPGDNTPGTPTTPTTPTTPDTGPENTLTKRQECIRQCRERTARGGDIKACIEQCMAGGSGDGGGDTTGCPPADVQTHGTKPYSGSGNCPCGAVVYVNSGSYACPPGYRMVNGSKGPSCRCEDWCAEGVSKGTLTSGCTGTGAGAGTTLGEYQWPQELQDLYARLMGRAGDILDQPYGYSQSALDQLFGRGFENVRAQGGASREAMNRALGASGQLGTGTALKEMGRTAWGTEKSVADTMRDVFLANELQKREDQDKYTAIAQSLFGTGAGFQQVLEAINAGRRGEGQNALALFLSYITSLMNSWKS